MGGGRDGQVDGDTAQVQYLRQARLPSLLRGAAVTASWMAVRTGTVPEAGEAVLLVAGGGRDGQVDDGTAQVQYLRQARLSSLLRAAAVTARWMTVRPRYST
jgi:hypothetical protein